MNKPLLTPFRLLLVILLAGLSLVARYPEVLETLGLSFHRQWFLDSYAILAANDAATAGVGTPEINPLDVLNRPHVYSDWWLGLRWLGLTRDDNFLFGGLYVMVFLAVALAGLRPATNRAALFLAAVLLSPPCLIALQRANNDLVIFALLGAGVLALRSAVTPARLAVFGALVVVATGLKYYPLVAAGALLVALPWRRSTLGIFLLTLVAALVVLASERGSIGRGLFELPQTIYQFGAAVLWRDLGLDRPMMAALAVGLLAAGAFLCVRQKTTAGLADGSRGPEGERLMFAVGACLLLGCFLAGTSYIYRWIFGLWLWPWLWREAAAGRGPARLALGLWLASIWADGALCLLVNTTGFSYRPAFGWRMATQSLTWVLMALLAGWLWEGFIAQARQWLARRRAA